MDISLVDESGWGCQKRGLNITGDAIRTIMVLSLVMPHIRSVHMVKLLVQASVRLTDTYTV